MTEAEWLTCVSKPQVMAEHARGNAGRRKLQMISAACARMMWNFLTPPFQRAVELTERYADGEATEAELASAYGAIRGYQNLNAFQRPGLPYYAALATAHRDPKAGMVEAVRCAVRFFSGGPPDWLKVPADPEGIRARVCDLFREILGNPFRPWAVNPSWLGGGLVQPDGKLVPVTADVRGLAEAVAADLGFDRLPVLADAAEEAGFTDPDLLAHLRHGTGHVRGCWAVDVLLGRG